MPPRYCSVAALGTALVFALSARDTGLPSGGWLGGAAHAAATSEPAPAPSPAGAAAAAAEEAAKPRVAPKPAKVPGPAVSPAPQPAVTLSPAKVATGGIGLVVVRGVVEGDAVTGTFNGEAIPFHAGNGVASALIGVDLDVKPGKYPLKVRVQRDGKAIAKDLTVSVFDGKYPEQSFTVPPEKDASEEDVELSKRIAREAKEIAAVWPDWSGERLWRGAFAPPARGTMKNFGSKRIINGKPRRPHSGADQSGKEGDPIHAIHDGKVVFAADQFFGGKTTVIDHGHGLFSMYMHQSKIDVQLGQPVKKGEKIGEVGMTGRATGPHLHWGLRLHGARVDPAKLLALAKDLDGLETAGPAATGPTTPMTTGSAGGPSSGGAP